MEEGKEKTQPAKTFVSRFRVGESHFTVDLQNELRLFPADVILCLDPVPNLTLPVYSGLSLTEVKKGPLTRITGGRCPLLYTVDEGSDIDANMLRYWLTEIKDFGLRRVLVTEPSRQEQSQMFVSTLVDAGLDFLGKVDKAEIVFTTFTSGLYEHAFSILARQKRQAYDEGNAIIDDDDLLRRLYSTLQCSFCSSIHPSLCLTDCCKHLKCQICVSRYPNHCQNCNRACGHSPAPLCSKIVENTIVTCACKSHFSWNEFEIHAIQCEKITSSCTLCSLVVPRAKLLDHFVEKHEDWVMEKYSQTVSVKELTILQQMHELQAPPRPQNWKCSCGNVNPPSVPNCFNCQLPKPL